MGFMDKAKKLAEQAQQKLDEAQGQFNQSSAPQGDQQGGGQKFDSHGRPIPQESPPPGAAAPAPDPTAGFGGAAPPPAPTGEEPPARAGEEPPAPADEEPPAPAADAPAPEEPADAPPAPSQPSGDSNPTPDPFKPLQQ